MHGQKLAYLVVGGVNTLLGLGLFALVFHVWGHVVGYMGSLVIAYALAILCAFQLHRRFVFKVTGHWARDLARYTSVHLTSLGINALALPLAVEVFGIAPLLAQTLVTGITVVLSYFAHKHISFRRHLGPGYPGDLIED
jgi:putative flippase GtrA